MSKSKYQFQNRDLSWLVFNARVLEEGMSKNVQLFDRLKFLGIFSSNLDEFFRVRVAGLYNIENIKNPNLKDLNGWNPKDLLDEIQRLVLEQLIQYGKYIREVIVKELESKDIVLYWNKPLEEAHRAEVRRFFKTKIAAYMSPVFLHQLKKGELKLSNRMIYLCFELISSTNKKQIAVLKIPTDHIPRFLRLSKIDSKDYFIFLDDIIRECAPFIFPNHQIANCWSVKLNRDAELHLSDEFSGDLVTTVKKKLENRLINAPARFLFDESMNTEVLHQICKKANIKKREMVTGGRYHNLNDLFGLENPRFPKLQENSWPSISVSEIEAADKMVDVLDKKEVLFHFPYHHYDNVLRFFNEAAIDPDVTKINVTFYRIAEQSLIANALLSALKNGKSVTVFVELKARFDEANNLEWAEKLEKAGATVIFSIPGIKVHAKIALIIRKTRGKSRKYAFLGTGNFNEKTANIYTDHGLLTSDETITDELDNLFKFLHKRKKASFNQLLVSQFNLYESFLELIDNEIKHAKKGHEASISVKINNLQEPRIIEKLYEASNAGVKINMIVRGICCLMPQIKGQSENIQVYRLVDKYLEHSRIFIFHNNGDEKIYMGSADWMNRNLLRRIEVVFPIRDKQMKTDIKQYLQTQFNDNDKLSVLSEKFEDVRIKRKVGEKKVRAQLEIYNWLKDND